MRYGLIALSIMFSVSSHAEVGPDGAPIHPEFQRCNSLDCSVYPTAKFRLESKALSGSSVYGEPFFVETDSSLLHKTIFPPTKINYVFNPASGQIFEYGKDYIATKEGIKLTTNSRILAAPKGFSSKVTDEENKLYKVRVTPEFQTYQYAITYEKNKVFKPAVVGSLGRIPSIAGRVPLKVTFFGDSITDGANSTEGFIAPFQPGYAGLVMAYLTSKHPGMWEYRNNSVGGWSTFNAASAVSYRVMDKKSDLVVLGFGMNDSNYVSTEDYRHNLRKVISMIRSKQSRVPILLVSGTVANPSSSIQKRELLNSYQSVLRDLTKEYPFVAVADVTGTWKMMLQNKRYLDLTGNGLNHPNDFGHRVIAEAVLSAILGKRY